MRSARLGTVIAVSIACAYTAVRRALHRRRDAADSDGSLAFPTEKAHDFVTDDGARLHVEDCGEGQPVLLLHGFGLSVNIWGLLARHLRDAGLRVLALDQRSFGESYAPSADFGIDELVADVAAVVDHLDLSGVILVGQSMGGVVAQAYALQQRDDRLTALVLMNTTCNLVGDLRNRLLASAMDSALVSRLTAIGPVGLLLARGAFGRKPAHRHLELTVRVGAEGDPAQRRGLVGRLLGIDLREPLRRLVIPTLILAGGADRITPARDTRQLIAALPHAHVATYPDAGHSLMLERSKQSAEEIAACAQRVERSAQKTAGTAEVL